MDDKLFDSYASDYDSYLASTTKLASKDISYFAEYKVAVTKRSLVSSPRRVLDYGCGIGRNIRFINKHFPEATCCGCDISIKSLEVARKENPNTTFFVNGNGCDLDPFDLILVTNVFHHVPVDKRHVVVKELKGLLSSKGSVFVFEHNPLNPLTQRVVKSIPFDADAILLRAKELTGLFRDQGFQIERKQYTLFYPEFASFLRWSEPYLGWLPLGAQYFVQASRHP